MLKSQSLPDFRVFPPILLVLSSPPHWCAKLVACDARKLQTRLPPNITALFLVPPHKPWIRDLFICCFVSLFSARIPQFSLSSWQSPHANNRSGRSALLASAQAIMKVQRCVCRTRSHREPLNSTMPCRCSLQSGLFTNRSPSKDFERIRYVSNHRIHRLVISLPSSLIHHCSDSRHNNNCLHNYLL